MIKEILVLELFFLDSCLKVKWQRWVKTRVIGMCGFNVFFLERPEGKYGERLGPRKRMF